MRRHEGQAEAEKLRRYINPDYLNQKRAEDRALQEKFDRLCGPVETKKMTKKIEVDERWRL